MTHSAAAAAPIEALVFDLGGVLLQLRPSLSFAAFAAIGMPQFESIWKNDTPSKSLYRFEVGQIDSNVFRQEVLEFCKHELTQRQFDTAFNAMLGDIDNSYFPLLQKLKVDYQLYLLSNNNDIHLKMIEQRYPQLRTYFHACYFSQEIALRKPHLDAFSYVTERTDIPAHHALFIDDSEQNVAASQQAGMRGIHLPRNTDVRAALAAIVPGRLP